MEHEIPARIKSLILDVVITRRNGRARPLTVSEAALLREHDLIDHVSRPTDRGFAVAGTFLTSTGDDNGH